jgi:adenylate kinase
MQNILFVGGIHGSGKGTICKKICEAKNYIHIIASELLKWEEISSRQNKHVENIETTQERLLKGLAKTVEVGKKYVLDGHYCLFDKEGKISKVPEQTFKIISPKLLTVLNEDVHLIKERLEKRDGIPYDYSILKEMQDIEIIYSKEIADNLGVKHLEISGRDYCKLLDIM